MDFSVKATHIEKQQGTCVVVGVFETQRLSPSAAELDKLSDGYITLLLGRSSLAGNVGETLLLHHLPNSRLERILLVGCGKECELDDRQYKKIIQSAIQCLTDSGSTKATSFLNELQVKGGSSYWNTRTMVESAVESTYLFDQFKSKKKDKDAARHYLHELTINIDGGRQELAEAEMAVQHGMALSAGVKMAKDLGNMPPNVCNTAYLASQARQLADSFSDCMTTQVIGEQQMKSLGMQAYLAVGQGSKNESLLAIIEYKGAAAASKKPIVLVGKGLTFDSGGISLKPGAKMDEMKYDMCGAAAVCGVMQTIAQLKLPLHVVGVLAGCENMPGGQAYRPGDILTTMSGQTVEVLNTDAEGRLVLCDVLTYVERFDPELVIDVATLTGACVIALGHHMSGLIANHPQLAQELLHAGEQSGDLAWHLPLDEQYQEQLKSNFADMANIGGPPAGTITAACFLSRFTGKYHWAHLDIAGTAWQSGDHKGATGRPVPLLTQFLLNYAAAMPRT